MSTLTIQHENCNETIVHQPDSIEEDPPNVHTNNDNMKNNLTSFVNNINDKIVLLEAELIKSSMDNFEPANTVVMESPSNLRFESRKIKTTVTDSIVRKSSVLRTGDTKVLREEECDLTEDNNMSVVSPRRIVHRWETFNIPRKHSIYTENPHVSNDDQGIHQIDGFNHSLNRSIPELIEKNQLLGIDQQMYINLIEENIDDGTLTQMQLKKQAILLQMYEAEESYVQSLKTLVMKYYLPSKNKQLITDHNLNIIFYKLPEIHMHHELIQYQYSNRLKHWNNKNTIGDVICQAFSKTSMKECYLNFISNFLSCQQTLRICRCSSAFSRFLEQQSKQDIKHYNIDDLLIQPVQRIPRYELFIKDLIRCTPEDHSDYGLLNEARECIHHLAVEIDQAKEELAYGAKEDLCQLDKRNNLQFGDDTSISSLSSSDDEEYTMQAKVTFQDNREKKKEGRIFLHSGQIAVMYRKKRTVFLSRVDPELEQNGILKSTFRKQYVPKFEERINNLEILDIANEEELRDKLYRLKDFAILQNMKELFIQLSNPIHEISEALDNALKLNQPPELLSKEDIKEINLKLREMQFKVKNNPEIHLTIWFNNYEDRRKWSNTINDYHCAPSLHSISKTHINVNS